ncbi:MAG: HlyD family secretion protein [Xanthobacteraceae bacterium]|nr:HlyD family secretion protein [Xanthobacteraceae bacterium]
MSTAERRPETGRGREAPPAPGVAPSAQTSPAPAPRRRRRFRVLPFLATLIVVAIAGALTWAMWRTYMGTPWTRDGRVRVYVVTIAPQVAGNIVQLPIVDDQVVHKGDLLMEIDPTNYKIAVDVAQAALAQAKATADNAKAESERREKLGQWASEEEKEVFLSKALAAQAQSQQMQANLEQAQVNLQRTRITSPVNGFVTNLQAQLGDYVTVGERRMTIVNSDSFWIDGYFEETVLGSIRDGDPAVVKLMGYNALLRGHVAGVARGINVADAASDPSGLAEVNPIFTWVRLAQRVPVRIALDEVPSGVRLVAGMTGTVQINPPSGRTGR